MRLLLAVSVAVVGCQTPGLMATPNLYLQRSANPFDDVSPSLQNNQAVVLYATDRAHLETDDGSIRYGFKRSPSVAFGVATVEFGEGVSWDVVEESSLTGKRSLDLAPRLTETQEIVRLSPSNERLEVVNGESRVSQAAADEETQAQERLNEVLHDALQHSDIKEVYLFIHGYNVNFENAVFTIAQIWHFLGRTGVPVSYTWPAGHGGIRGYTADRESGEFTIFHLKQFMRALAACPDVKEISIIAHSRGTDVALTALRELHIESTAAGASTRETLKIGSVILAAPDLDFEVVTQRIGAEGLLTVPERMTVYISPEDKAIGVSSWLFDSVRRIGRLRLSDLSLFQRKSLQSIPGMEVVDARIKKSDLFGHSYFYHSPAVSSDLILNLRDDCAAGPEHGRPLVREEDGGFWILTSDYPQLTTTE